jgi:hypothetical protein
MLERENVGGFYLDVLQGCSLPCYWTPHGHSAAGGDSMSRGMHELMEIVTNAVKVKDPEAIITGENTSENMIDVSDGILQVALLSENTAPIFAAVYQDYIRRYGLEISTGPGDDFFIECASMFVEGMQVGRLRLRPRDGALSFQKPEHQEMLAFLKRVVDYYKQPDATKFLVYGRLLRPLEFLEPSAMPVLSYKDGGKFPALMSGVFRSEDGQLGVFIANASGNELKFQADMDLARYHVPQGTTVDVDAIAQDGATERVAGKLAGVLPLAGSLRPRGITLFHIKITN